MEAGAGPATDSPAVDPDDGPAVDPDDDRDKEKKDRELLNYLVGKVLTLHHQTPDQTPERTPERTPEPALDKARDYIRNWMMGIRPDTTDNVGIIDMTKIRAAFESGDMQTIFDVLDVFCTACEQERIINSLKHRFGQDFGPDGGNLEPESTK